MSAPAPLGSLSPGAQMMDDKNHHEHGYGGYFAWAVLWFIIVVVIVWLILLAVKPTWVQKTDSGGNPTGEVDNGKAFLWAVVIAFIICIIVWIVYALAGWGGHSHGRRY